MEIFSKIVSIDASLSAGDLGARLCPPLLSGPITQARPLPCVTAIGCGRAMPFATPDVEMLELDYKSDGERGLSIS